MDKDIWQRLTRLGKVYSFSRTVTGSTTNIPYFIVNKNIANILVKEIEVYAEAAAAFACFFTNILPSGLININYPPHLSSLSPQSENIYSGVSTDNLSITEPFINRSLVANTTYRFDFSHSPIIVKINTRYLCCKFTLGGTTPVNLRAIFAVLNDDELKRLM